MATKTKTPDTAAALDAAAEQLDQAQQTQKSTAERVETLRQAVIDGDTTVSAADIATAEAAANHAQLLAEAARRRLDRARIDEREHRAAALAAQVREVAAAPTDGLSAAVRALADAAATVERIVTERNARIAEVGHAVAALGDEFATAQGIRDHRGADAAREALRARGMAGDHRHVMAHGDAGRFSAEAIEPEYVIAGAVSSAVQHRTAQGLAGAHRSTDGSVGLVRRVLPDALAPTA